MHSSIFSRGVWVVLQFFKFCNLSKVYLVLSWIIVLIERPRVQADVRFSVCCPKRSCNGAPCDAWGHFVLLVVRSFWQLVRNRNGQRLRISAELQDHCLWRQFLILLASPCTSGSGMTGAARTAKNDSLPPV